MALPIPCIYLVTDRAQLAGPRPASPADLDALEAWIDEAVTAGVDVVQIRERDLDADVVTALVARVVARSAGRAKILVNDRLDVAMAAGADGVHLRGDGPPIDRVRAITPSGFLIGRSVHAVDDVRRARGADYVIFGPVFDGGSKPAGVPRQGVDMLAAAVAADAAPVIAIGGITAARVAACAAAGASGVAAISLFLPVGVAPDAIGPSRAVAALRAAWRAAGR